MSSANPSHGPDEREFHADWFTPIMPTRGGPVHALILDDTWTTGARAQSLAHAFKSAGAKTVASVILGRHVDPDYGPSRQLLTAIADPIFDATQCAADVGDH